MSARRTAALRKVVRSVAAPDRGATTDRELLREFVRANDQSAFETLVTRHTGMVLGVCRRVLPKVQDAEDACQATFLVLARKASVGHWQESIANWLYTTARRVACNARVAAERRARREETVAVPESVEPVDLMTGRELLVALDAALDGLPARYREPLVLCYLEGLTRDEAAQRLGVPLATLHTRIDRARKRLHEVLTKAGCALGAGLLVLAASVPAGALPPRLVESVLATTSGRTPISVGELAKGIAVNGSLTRIKLAVVGAFGLVALGFTLAAMPAVAEPVGAPPEKTARRESEGDPKSDPPKGAREPADPLEKAAGGEKRTVVEGEVLGPDGKPVAGAKLFLYTATKRTVVPLGAAGADGAFALAFGANEYGRHGPELRFGETGVFALPFGASENGAIVATAPGYGLAWQRLLEYPPRALRLWLTPDEPIRGRVIDLEGKPVGGVTVSVVGLSQPPDADTTLNRWLNSAREPRAARVGFEDSPLSDRWSGFAGLLVPVTSDGDGKFEIRGAGRDRIVNLRVTGPTVATHEMSAVTRTVDRFATPTDYVPYWGETIQGSEPVVAAAPVPVTTGRVTDSASGKPIPGAVLHIEHQIPRSFPLGLRTTTDKDGRFTLPGLPLDKPGFSVTVIPPVGAPYHSVGVNVPDAPAARAAFDVKLVRGVPATVKIIDKVTRKPVKSHIRYGVFRDDNPNVKAVPNVWHGTEWRDAPFYTPRQSEFHIVVFPGKGLLAAFVGWPERGNYLSGVGADAFEKYRDEDQLFGLVSTADRATSIHVRGKHTFAAIDVPSDAKEFQYTLELDPGLTVTGRLVDADGKAVTGAQSFGLVNDPTDATGVVVPEDWAPPANDANFAALALRDGEKRRVMFVHSERKLAGSAVVVGGGVKPVEVRMEPWGEATGRLVGADGKPVMGWIGLNGDWAQHPEPKLGSSPFCHAGGYGPEADSDGRFRVTGLVPGLTYRWVARAGKHGEAVVPDTIVKPGQTIDLGDIVVRPEQP